MLWLATGFMIAVIGLIVRISILKNAPIPETPVPYSSNRFTAGSEPILRKIASLPETITLSTPNEQYVLPDGITQLQQRRGRPMVHVSGKWVDVSAFPPPLELADSSYRFTPDRDRCSESWDQYGDVAIRVVHSCAINVTLK